MKACVFTLGCKMNEVESESLLRGLEELGYEVTEELGAADLYLLNTCAVTAEAEKKSRQAVARMRKYNPTAPVVVCGCAAQNDPRAFAEKEGVTLVTGAQRKDRVLALLRERGIFCESDEGFCELPAPRRTKTRAYLRIQDGCNRFCSYCLIPYLRGRSRSRSAASVLYEANSLGAKEIVLTGIDVTSYRDGETDLGGLIRKLKEVPARFRLGSLEAGIVTEELLSAMKEAGNVLPHFHLSLQSGSDSVLRAMNRRGSRESLTALLRKIREKVPGVTLRTTLITGFPGETEEDFTELAEFVKEIEFDRLGCFAYSQEEGTPAAELPEQLEEEVKEHRAELIMDSQTLLMERKGQAKIGQIVEVLTEGFDRYAECWFGRSAMDAPDIDGKVFFTAEKKPVLGSFVKVLIEDCVDCDLFGKRM